MTNLTPRDRILAAIHGQPVDRVPFAVYDGAAASVAALQAELGPDQVTVQRWVRPYRLVAPNCQTAEQELVVDGRRRRRRWLQTPWGDLWEERPADSPYAVTPAIHPFISETREYDLLLAYLRDTVVEPDLETYAAVDRELGPAGVPHCVLPPTPYLQLLHEWVNADDLTWHLLESPPVVLACIEEMQRILREVFAIVAQLRPPYVVFPEHLHAPELGRTSFNKYCVPLYQELAELLSGDQIPIFLLADGDLRQLWYDIEDAPIGGLDGLAPPPEHDTTVSQAAQLWPALALGVKLPTTTFLKPAKVAYEKALQMLQEGAASPRLLLQVTDPVPPGRWKIIFPAILKAIDDFARVHQP
jgi:hypothetical protein